MTPAQLKAFAHAAPGAELNLSLGEIDALRAAGGDAPAVQYAVRALLPARYRAYRAKGLAGIQLAEGTAEPGHPSVGATLADRLDNRRARIRSHTGLAGESRMVRDASSFAFPATFALKKVTSTRTTTSRGVARYQGTSPRCLTPASSCTLAERTGEERRESIGAAIDVDLSPVRGPPVPRSIPPSPCRRPCTEPRDGGVRVRPGSSIAARS